MGPTPRSQSSGQAIRKQAPYSLPSPFGWSRHHNRHPIARFGVLLQPTGEGHPSGTGTYSSPPDGNGG